MAVVSTLSDKKIKIKCAENKSQTLSNIQLTATDGSCYNGGMAFSTLMDAEVQAIVLIEEKKLTQA